MSSKDFLLARVLLCVCVCYATEKREARQLRTNQVSEMETAARTPTTKSICITSDDGGIRLRVALLATACLLGLSGVLKLRAVYQDPFAQDSVVLPTGLRLAAVALELFLAAWLLIGGSSRIKWLAALITLASFAVVSLWAGLTGQVSCGCLGALRISPWLMLGIDVLGIQLLWHYRPEWSGRSLAPLSPALIGFTTSLTCMLVVVSLIWSSEGMYRFFSWLQGHEIIVYPSTIRLSPAKRGDFVSSECTLLSLSTEPIQIIGASSRYGDLLTHGLPAEVLPGARLTLPIKIRQVGPNGWYARRIYFMTDSKADQRVVFRIVGKVSEP